jgi:predicted transcriptional regulator
MAEAQKQNINEGIKDVEEGRTVSSAEFWKILKNG